MDTTDLITWAILKFPKVSLDAWSTFTEEREFAQQTVKNIVDASWRNHFITAAAEAEFETILTAFRDRRDVHRIFLRKADAQPGDKDLLGVVTQVSRSKKKNKFLF